MIHKTVMAIQKYKILDIIGPNELNICITSCEAIFNQFNILLDTLNGKVPVNKVAISSKITELISEMIIIFKNFGTETFSDLLSILLEEDYIDNHLSEFPLADKYKLINEYVH